MKDKTVNVLIVGAGKGGTAFIELFKGSDKVKISGVVDINDDAPGIRLAKELNIPHSNDCRTFFEKKELDEIINVTGSRAVQEELLNNKPENVEVIGGHSAKLMWGFFDEYTQSETALKISEQKFKDLTEATTDWIWEVDKDGKYTYVSPKVEDLLGYTSGEVLGKSPFDFMPKGEQKKIRDIFIEKVTQKEPFYQLENENIHKDGHSVILETNGIPVFDEKGNVKGYRGIDRDITDRAASENMLKESEAKWKSLVNNAPNIIMISDRDGVIQFINHTAAGLSTEDVIGKTLYDFIDPDYRATVKETMEHVFKTGKAARYQIKSTGSDGSSAWHDSQVGPIGQNGEVVAMISVVTDVTEKKKSDERVQKLNETLCGLSIDHEENVNKLTAACGEILGGVCALYNRIDGDMLCSIGKWQTPPDFKTLDNAEGHICYDVIKHGSKGAPYIVKNLEKTPYSKKDPNVAKYGLKTYIGYPVYCFDKPVGSLCVVYRDDIEFDESDKRFMGIIAEAISREEERKQMTDELRQTGDRLSLLIKTMPIISYTCRAEGNFAATYITNSITDITGYKPEDFTSKSSFWVDHIHPDDRNRVFAELGEVFKADLHQHEYRFKIADGSYRYLLDVMRLIRKEDGTPDYIIGVMSDVSDRRQIEDALKESESRYRTIFENTGTAIVIIEDDMTVSMANAEFEKISGFSKEEIEGRKNVLDFTGKDYLDKVKEYHRLRRIDPEAVPGNYDISIMNKEGKEVDVYLTVALIPDTRRSVASILDITELKRNEQELTKQKELLDNTNKALEHKLKELQEALGHIKRLEGLVPICANCKKMMMEGKDSKDQKAWIPLEKYISERSEASFTHGLCPDCAKKMYGQIRKNNKKD
ncbi:MAG: PAS domain S-box protein [Candidatus Omnitrophica bacterium]|nr:PAS domain S-box protein [Candidatus Omnitrophota bacterium]